MLDKPRILSKIDELDTYLSELDQVKPKDFEAYASSIEKKRSCERLLQISIECVIEISSLLIKGKSLGLPADEDDIFTKLARKKIYTKGLADTLKQVKAFRNILVHRYGTVDDRLVYQFLTTNISDFKEFRKQTIKALK